MSPSPSPSSWLVCSWKRLCLCVVSVPFSWDPLMISKPAGVFFWTLLSNSRLFFWWLALDVFTRLPLFLLSFYVIGLFEAFTMMNLFGMRGTGPPSEPAPLVSSHSSPPFDFLRSPRCRGRRACSLFLSVITQYVLCTLHCFNTRTFNDIRLLFFSS
jgi:hypothetical protein